MTDGQTDGRTATQTDTALTRIPERDGRADRQTYRQMNIQTDKIAISISRVSENVTHQCHIAICKVNWILGASEFVG